MASNNYSQIPIPKYYQVYLSLKEKIDDGAYSDGTSIPSERQLVELYDVSRITVVKAIDLLVQEGLITRKQGLGNYVSKPSLKVPQNLMTVALVIPGTLEGYISSVLTGMIREAAFATAQIQLIGPQIGKKNNLFFDELCCGDLDGVIIYPAEKGWQNWVRAVIESSVPVVLIDRFFPELACDHVLFNDEEASFQLTKDMIEHGMRKIAFIPGTEINTTSVINRLKGFQRAHIESGIPIDEDLMWFEVYSHFKTGAERMLDDSSQLLDEYIRRFTPDGIFSVNQLVSEKFYFNLLTLQNHQMLTQLSVQDSLIAPKVSYQIGQAGICDHELNFQNPYYQRMALQDGSTLGKEAFTLLMNRIQGLETQREPVHKVVTMRFV